jgi:predicted nucleic acid-binding protein
VHVAIMEQHGIDRVLSFDASFNGIRGIERIVA